MAELNCVCPICGKEFHRKPSHLKKYNKHTPVCSRECLRKYRSSIYEGESNPNFGNTGVNNPLFKGKTTVHCKYLWDYAPDHPFSVDSLNHRVRQHRLVAEQYLLNEENSVEIDGVRYLKPEYDVHHIDFNKFNNAPSNLMVLTRAEHKALHHKINKGGVGSTGK